MNPQRDQFGKKAERLGEILDAYEHCIIAASADSVTMQKVADEADITRSLLYHRVNTRDELLERAIERFLARAGAPEGVFEAQMPNVDRCRAYVELLFNPSQLVIRKETILYQALVDASESLPSLRKKLRGWSDVFVADLQKEIRHEYRDAIKDTSSHIAEGIIALYFHSNDLALVNAPAADIDSCRQAAMTLLELVV